MRSIPYEDRGLNRSMGSREEVGDRGSSMSLWGEPLEEY
jgi:hypothetical protein